MVTGLNINEGEQFNVCMKNENDGKTNCVTATLKDEDKAVYVDIRYLSIFIFHIPNINRNKNKFLGAKIKFS